MEIFNILVYIDTSRGSPYGIRWSGEKLCLRVCMCAYMCPRSVGTNNAFYVLLLALQFGVVNCSVVVITAYR